MLQIVVAGHCFGCAEAERLRAALASSMPAVPVEWIDLEVPESVRPPGVVAVPAYLVDGQLAFTGNPTLQDLQSRLLSASPEVRDGV